MGLQKFISLSLCHQKSHNFEGSPSSPTMSSGPWPYSWTNHWAEAVWRVRKTKMDQGLASTFTAAALLHTKTKDPFLTVRGPCFEHRLWFPDTHRGQSEGLLVVPIANDPKLLHVLTSCICFVCVRAGTFHFLLLCSLFLVFLLVSQSAGACSEPTQAN